MYIYISCTYTHVLYKNNHNTCIYIYHIYTYFVNVKNIHTSHWTCLLGRRSFSKTYSTVSLQPYGFLCVWNVLSMTKFRFHISCVANVYQSHNTLVPNISSWRLAWLAVESLSSCRSRRRGSCLQWNLCMSMVGSADFQLAKTWSLEMLDSFAFCRALAPKELYKPTCRGSTIYSGTFTQNSGFQDISIMFMSVDIYCKLLHLVL